MFGSKGIASQPLFQSFRRLYSESGRSIRIGSVPRRSCKSQDKESQIIKTGFEILFLGTGAGLPSIRRNPTCICLYLSKSNYMFDCAEGSLRQLMKSCVRVPLTSKFFITHLHGDHLYGLPGILCTLDNYSNTFDQCVDGTSVPRRRKISVYGPFGLYAYLNMTFATSQTRLNNLEIIVHELVSPELLHLATPFDRFAQRAPKHPAVSREYLYAIQGELNEPVWNVCEDDGVRVKAGILRHTITSFGFVVEEDTIPGTLQKKLILQRGLKPGPLYSKLKQGMDVRLENGDIIRSAEVVGPPARGRKAVIMGDTADSSQMFDIAKDCDILVHEATVKHGMVSKALERGHSSGAMAGYAAKRTNATLLVLTHFSQRFQQYTANNAGPMTTYSLVEEARKVFRRRAVIAASDFLCVPIPRHPFR